MEFNEALRLALRRFDPTISLKDQQINAIKNIYDGNDVVVVLPTGYDKIRESGLRACSLDARTCDVTDDGEVQLCMGDHFIDIEKGNANILFAHPEAIVSSKKGRALLLKHRERVVAVAVDEAHCCVDWSDYNGYQGEDVQLER
ncbi:uncharacterized protein LOC144438147 [Glandiceps talaboti]